MAGSKEQGLKAAQTNKRLYGADFYSTIGKLGGSKRNPKKGFGGNRELASRAGAIGGAVSKPRKRNG